MFSSDLFSIRRAIERLRDGLFDAVAVDRLTVQMDRIEKMFSQGLKDLECGRSGHLCICGSYGQGKSHTINYLNRYALSEGFATSLVSLDLREVPLHNFPVVYQSIMASLSLPDGLKLTKAWKQTAEKISLEALNAMPHLFRMILKAMLKQNKQLTAKEKSLKKHANYKPREFGYWLEKALAGHRIPLAILKNVLTYREVKGYRDQSLMCRGNASYLQMVQSLGKLLKSMGYKGLVLFFDEAESIAQVRLGNRIKSYEILDQFFQTHDSVYPIFAFTDDFFDRIDNELFEDDKQIFSKNYAKAWQNVNIARLQDFSSQEWELLLDRLIQLYAQAYQVDVPSQTKILLQNLLENIKAQETRFKLKALVNLLDVYTQ